MMRRIRFASDGQSVRNLAGHTNEKTWRIFSDTSALRHAKGRRILEVKDCPASLSSKACDFWLIIEYLRPRNRKPVISV
ncbi:MAG: hypothetical protein CMF59_13445 [Leptospiraceae bacterium]|nr:hypothetical protein [Leptospiraceae bacterium]